MSKRTPAERLALLAERLALLAELAALDDADLLTLDFSRLVTTEHELDELLDQYELERQQRKRRRTA